MEVLTENDLRKIVLMKEKLAMLKKNTLDLSTIICDLGGILNTLESISESWKDDFQEKVNILEIIYDSIEDGSIWLCWIIPRFARFRSSLAA